MLIVFFGKDVERCLGVSKPDIAAASVLVKMFTFCCRMSGIEY